MFKVVLKSLGNSKDITADFLREVSDDGNGNGNDDDDGDIVFLLLLLLYIDQKHNKMLSKAYSSLHGDYKT